MYSKQGSPLWIVERCSLLPSDLSLIPITLGEPDERLGVQGLDSGNGANELGSLRHSRGTLELNLNTRLTSLLAGSIVSLDTLKEILTALGVLSVFNADVNTLVENAATYALRNDDTDSTARDVPDGTSLTVVELVGHTLVDSTITLDINNVTNAVDSLDTAKSNLTLLSEVLLEEGAGAGAVTVRVRHPKVKGIYAVK